MKKDQYMSWDTYFMAIAVLSTYRSKDKKTQNGACIVDQNNRIIGIGYNGLPRGCDDSDPAFWADEDDSDVVRSKHTYVVHAEKNAIYNCMHHDLTGSTMYSTQFPCNTCAQAILQVRISRVVYLWRKDHHSALNCAVEKMFASVGDGLKVESYDSLNAPDAAFVRHLRELGSGYYQSTEKGH